MRRGVVAVLVVGLLAVPAGTASPSISHVIASAPTWSPDGATLAYTEEIPTANPRFDVVVSSAAGGRSHMLASGAARPLWSPDGAAIAYLGRDQSSGNLSELWIVDVSSLIGGRSLVTTDVATFAWSANGEQVFYGAGNTCGPLHVVSRYDSSKARVVATGATPVPSPDGKLLAYLSPPSPGRCTNGVGYLSVARVDGTGARVVLPEQAIRVSWSPDSTRLAVEVQSDEGPRIVLVDSDGSHPTLVASGSHPAWSPDGHRVAFLSPPFVHTSFPRDEPSLQVLDVRSGVVAKRLLSASAELAGGPVWSPDGQRLALSRALERGGTAEGQQAGLNRDVAIYTVPLTAPARSRRISPAPCDFLEPRCTIAGGPGGNLLSGTRGRDVIWGYGGDDRIRGGAGDDDLHGGSGGDVLFGGSGRDVIAGGAGNDVIFTRDGSKDAVYCGSGYDVVVADTRDDVARDCERVVRG